MRWLTAIDASALSLRYTLPGICAGSVLTGKHVVLHTHEKGSALAHLLKLSTEFLDQPWQLRYRSHGVIHHHM